MTKKFSKIRCAHCVTYYEELTSDHVFPKSWYPETTPENIEKSQMPSCRECNSKMGKIENELLLKFGMCIQPFAHSSLGVAQKAMRSVDPWFARDRRDAEHRKKRREKLLQDTIDPKTVSLSSIFPGFGFHSGQDPANEIAITVADADLRTIAVKIIRGITWAIDKRYIEPEYGIAIHFVRDPKLFPFYEPLVKFGRTYSLGPGLTAMRAVADEDRISSLYYLEIWRQFFMYGSVRSLTESSI